MTIIQDIIQHRKCLHTTDDEATSHGMQAMTSALIGEIASYLELNDHLSFGRCNRETFIGCTSPCTLRRLDLTEVENYRLVDLCKYPQIRCLALNLQSFTDLVLPDNGTVCNHLNALKLDNRGCSDAEIEQLLNTTAFPFANITDLNLSNFGDIDNYFPTNKLVQLLSKFPSTTCLQMTDVDSQLPDSVMPQVAEYLANVTVLKANPWCDHKVGVSALSQILSIRSHKLKALELPSLHGFDLPSNIGFPSLKESVILDPLRSTSLVNAVRNSTKSLKRIYFSWEQSDESVVIEIIPQQKKLEQIMISMEYENLQKACTVIERGIFNIRRIKKENIQIKFVVNNGDSAKAADVVFNMARVINALQSTESENWKLRVALSKGVFPTMENWESEIEYFQHQNRSKFDVQYIDDEIIITNKGNGVNDCIFNNVFHCWLTDDIW